MAYLVIELSFPNLTISDLNDKYGLNAGDKADALNQAINACATLESGAQSGSIQSTTRDVTAGVSASGTNSKQVFYPQ